VARKKSDAGDALVLANILRTDMAAHRPLPADSELAQAIAVLARAQQDAVWERTCAHNKLRSLLREYYPALLNAFTDQRGGLLRPEARALLAAAPTPRAAAKLTITQLATLLRHAGRQRGIDTEAARLQEPHITLSYSFRNALLTESSRSSFSVRWKSTCSPASIRAGRAEIP
jgi:transposase